MKFFHVLWVFCAAALTAEPSPQALMDSMDAALAPDRYEGTMTMTTVKPDKTTEAAFTLLYRKGTGSLIEFTSPARIKGMNMLVKSAGLWLYSPAAGSTKPLRLSARQSFQGSVFSNGDVSEPHFSRDYEAVIDGHETLDVRGLGSLDAVILDGAPKTAQAPYGKVRIWMLADSGLPLKIEYTAKSGLLFKRMEFSDFRLLAGAKRPSVYRMESLEEPGTYTVLTIIDLQSRPEMPEGLFNENGLSR